MHFFAEPFSKLRELHLLTAIATNRDISEKHFTTK